MTQGIWIGAGRPKSKKAIKDTIAEGNGFLVRLEATSVFGNEYSGRVVDMPQGVTHYFVGPDPYKNRKFYGQIVRVGDTVKVS